MFVGSRNVGKLLLLHANLNVFFYIIPFYYKNEGSLKVWLICQFIYIGIVLIPTSILLKSVLDRFWSDRIPGRMITVPI